MIELKNFINGQFLPTDEYIESFDPSTAEAYAKVPRSGKSEVDLAVAAAEKAIGG